MLNQMEFTHDGKVVDKVEMAIRRLQAFEPKEEGYFVAFSGGKDSQCVYHLCKLAGVKFDAHYTITSVDPPELYYFIRDMYPDVEMIRPTDAQGNRVNMWNLIRKNLMPPTRLVRYCCEELKETAGQGRVTVTGVRWAESANRKNNQSLVTIPKPSKALKEWFEESEVDYTETKKGGVILNLDNDEARRSVEHCFRTHKTLVNPIIDWSDEDVWEFLNDVVKVPHCRLYDEGCKRIGCIGCPMANQEKEFARYPKYKDLYIHAFDRMLKIRAEKNLETGWKTAQEVFDWWIS